LIGGFAGAAIAHAIAMHGFSDYVITEGGKMLRIIGMTL
jgi:PiT family inorganic phosphate transporter